MQPHFQITKASESQHLVSGILTCTGVDRDGESLDYFGSKPFFEKWSKAIHDATAKVVGEDKASFGNVREQHSGKPVGKFINIEFDDASQTIRGTAKIVDEDCWSKIANGVYSAFSVAGALVKSAWRNGVKLLTIDPRECSVVDFPANPQCTFDFVKSAGGTEKRKFVEKCPREQYNEAVKQFISRV